jgi:hypothetical protein
MRTTTLLILAAVALAAAATSCSDYFDGTNLYFDFNKLDPLVKLVDADKDCGTITDEATCNLPDPPPKGHLGCTWKWVDDNDHTQGGTCQGTPAGLCADDDYIDGTRGFPAHSDQQPRYEYRAWATINGGPALLARFTVRECTVANTDNQLKKMITSIVYHRDPTYGYADRASKSAYYGVVDDVINAFPVGSAYMDTLVRMDNATEVFITEETLDAPETQGPDPRAVLMKGNLTQEGDVYSAVLSKLSLSGPSGHVTAIVVNRTSAW